MAIQRLPAMKVRLASLSTGHYYKGQAEMEPNVLVTPGGTTVSRVRVIGTIVSRFINEDATFASVTLDDGSDTIRVKAFRDDLPKINELGVGDTIDLIARVREYEGELYLMPEVVIPVSDHNWELVRRLELLREDRRETNVLARSSELRSSGVPMEEGIKDLGTEFGLSERAAEAVLAGPVERTAASRGEVLPSTQTPLPPAPAQAPVPAPVPAPESATEKVVPNARVTVLALIKKLDEGDGVPYNALKEASKLGEGFDEVITELISEGEIFEPRTGKYKRLE